jgi:hypothetical protein
MDAVAVVVVRARLQLDLAETVPTEPDMGLGADVAEQLLARASVATGAMAPPEFASLQPIFNS